jgi:hypothetical protein
LKLERVLDEGQAVTQVIGPDGGTIETSGSDGTAYVLTVPAEALAFDTPITMTPLAGLEGFPNETPPEHVLGVELTPNGLEFARPATLSIESASGLPETDIVAIAYRGEGDDAAFHYFDQSGTTATLMIGHLSGYTTVSPFLIGDESPSLLRKFFTQDEIEARLRSEVAYFLTILRQLQNIDAVQEWNVVDIARHALSLYRRLVISPRVAVADRSCRDAHLALLAYIEYQQQRQLLGVAEDPTFDLVGAGMLAPQALIDLATEVCFREEFERCARFGDFYDTAVFFYDTLQRTVILGSEPSQEHIALAQEYLRRCGRWRLRVTTVSIITSDLGPVGEEVADYQSTREFHVQWRPSEGTYGLVGSTITGSGPVEAVKLVDQNVGCTHVISDVRSTRDAEAELVHLGFNHFFGPTQTGEPLPPVPASLTVKIELGELTFNRSGCPTHGDTIHDLIFNLLLAHGITTPSDQPPPSTVEFKKDWQFRSEPFKATLVQEDSGTTVGPAGSVTLYVRNEVTVAHESL